MLFNSFIFIFVFLPVALILTFTTARFGKTNRLILTLLSLGFYAFWRPHDIFILVGSICFNYFVGAFIQRAYAAKSKLAVQAWLGVGLVVDLGLLGWFKYANFVADNLADLGINSHLAKIALPLAISFFTFQKIAYLVDSARGQAKQMSFIDFSLFASFFPQLIAGPITHYAEIVPQFGKRDFGKLIWRNMMIGLVIFAIGLFKKTVIADTMVNYVDPLFHGAAKGEHFNLATGWLAAITFTFQIYFDFSGYSDMAIGLARMFGVKLPLNFHSPLRASSIIDFWRRWHMTLQRFIVAYLFQPMSIPLNRFAATKNMSAWSTFAISVALPSFVSFFIIGVWHGAGWTFAIFGLMHAGYVCANQFWLERRAARRRALRKLNKTLPPAKSGRWDVLFGNGLTLVAVMFANVIFRAPTISQAISIWRGMIGWDHARSTAVQVALFGPGLAAIITVCTILVFLMPNTQQIMGRYMPALNWSEWRNVGVPAIRWAWRPSPVGVAFIVAALLLGVIFIERGQAVFIYFNF